MSDPIEELKQRVKWLEKRIDELEKDHGTVAVYLKSTEPQLRNAILELVEYLANARPREKSWSVLERHPGLLSTFGRHLNATLSGCGHPSGLLARELGWRKW